MDANITPVSSDIPMPVFDKRANRRIWKREHYAANKLKIRARKQNDYQKNKKFILERHAKYRAENPEKIAVSSQNWVKRNPEKRAAIIRNYINSRETIDPQFKLLRSLRARLRVALKKNSKSGTMLELLGCSIAELMLHIESLWLVGMNWNNRSARGWHIDHKRPLSSFDLTKPDQLREACHYTNLQPLWWQDNLTKGNKICP